MLFFVSLLASSMRFLALILLSAVVFAAEVVATVERVSDGDTIAVTTEAGEMLKVRLLYVDTAESRDNGHGKAMAEGKAASEFLAKLLPIGCKVTLRSSRAKLERDRYARTLAVVWANQDAAIGVAGSPAAVITVEENVNAAIIRAGWSVYWRKYGGDPDPKQSANYQDAQAEAKASGTGAWATIPKWMTDKSNERTAPRR